MNDHVVEVKIHRHRVGVLYFQPCCSCGWRTFGITRSRDIADQQAALHVARERSRSDG